MKGEHDPKQIEMERIVELPKSEREQTSHDFSRTLDQKPAYPKVLLRRLTDDDICTHTRDMHIFETEQQKPTATKKRKIPLEKDLNPSKKLNNNSAKIANTSDSD